MCLYTLWKKGRIAKHPIRCYKIVSYFINNKEDATLPEPTSRKENKISFFGPFTLCKMYKGKHVHSNSKYKKSYSCDSAFCPFDDSYYRCITNQGVHAFTKKKDAVSQQEANDIIIETTIPVGATYWKGSFVTDISDDDTVYCDAIASSEMIMGKMISSPFKNTDKSFHDKITDEWNNSK